MQTDNDWREKGGGLQLKILKMVLEVKPWLSEILKKTQTNESHFKHSVSQASNKYIFICPVLMHCYMLKSVQGKTG